MRWSSSRAGLSLISLILAGIWASNLGHLFIQQAQLSYNIDTDAIPMGSSRLVKKSIVSTRREALLAGSKSDVEQTPPHPLSENSCLTKANLLLNSELAYNLTIPVFSFITLAPSSRENLTDIYHYITFNAQHPTMNLDYTSAEYKWYCEFDDNQNETGAPVGRGCAKGSLTIKCPYHGPSMSLQMLHGVPDNTTISYPRPTRYNVNAHVQCAVQQYQQHRKQLLQKHSATFNNDNAVKIASCFSMKGDVNRRRIKEFVAYHRLQGYTRFFIYFNEPYIESEMRHDLPLEQPDIEYIPSHLQKTPDHEPFFPHYWQLAMETDCLHKCRSYGADYCAMHDVDEFVQVLRPNTTVKDILAPYKDQDKILGLRIYTTIWPYNDTTTYMLDNAMRDSRHDHKMRFKMYVKPTKVWYFRVHWICDESGYNTHGYANSMILTNATHDIRINHYRNGLPLKGKLIEDTSFRDKFRSKVVDLIKVMK